MPHRTAKKIHKAIQEAEKIMIIPHQNPDGDAIGSATALAHYLEAIKKPYAIFCSTEIPKNLHFLTDNCIVRLDKEIWDENFSTLIVVDAGDLEYAGVSRYLERKNPKPFIIGIDHHATNRGYGDLNLVIEKASSTTEILYLFFKTNKIEISPEMATSLMTGLITDTGNFSNSGTSKQALHVASDLARKRAHVMNIRDNILKNKSINTLKLWGLALSRLSIHPEHHIAYTYLSQNDILQHEVTEEEVEGIANLLNDLNEGHASLIFKEKKGGAVKGSLRTTKDNVDVSMIAKAFGGGGHKKASGFTIEHPLEEAIEHFFRTLSVKQLAFVKEETL
ncbi:MAG: bifunctional oligoribonuclease/PAP phosphatase NrnA [Candidatus Magasanikbacteria bacterium]|nr:bifunctional oligoribonuclease/PAP phosphatase NrnA [Candidatus Magasanikbacteria bacterium]